MGASDLVKPLVRPVDPTGRLSPAEFGAVFQSFTASAFRLETLSEYRVEESAHKVELFLKGTPLPPDHNDAWCQLVSAAQMAGKRMSRVHVIPRRLTPYLRYEIEWGYVFNAEAGEEILLLAHDRPSEIFDTWPLPDFWLFDDGTERRTCVRMHYDSTGQFQFGQLVADPSEFHTYRRARDVAVDHAVSLQQYLAELRNS